MTLLMVDRYICLFGRLIVVMENVLSHSLGPVLIACALSMDSLQKPINLLLATYFESNVVLAEQLPDSFV